MRIYDREAVARALPYEALIDALERAFQSDAVAPERTHHQIGVPGTVDATLLMMPAWRVGESLGIKIATIFPGNVEMNLPSVNASYLLLDANSGEPRALLDGAELTVRRTAAASALAARYLARAEASVLLMVGSGKLAPHLIAAHAAARPISKVMVWGRRKEAAEAVADGLATAAYSVTPVEDLEVAAGKADIISCATLATEPLIRGGWLRPGQHVDLVGAYRADMREADDDAIVRADVYVDTFAGALAEAGEIVRAIRNGAIKRSDIVGDLRALTRETCRPRQSDEAITLFKSVGTALEDLAAAELAATLSARDA